MTSTLNYVIKYVGNMDRAVEFHIDQMGLKLRFQSPDWSEFETGQTTLALHRASTEHPAGTCELGFGVADTNEFCAARIEQGVEVVSPPRELHGQRMASFRDPDGAEFGVSCPIR